MSSLSGKVALVTGASRGLGKAIALELGRQGVMVGVNYNNTAEGAEDAAKTINLGEGRAIAVKGDVGSFADCEKMVEQVSSELGPIDILINNAGLNKDRTLRRMSVEEWESVIQTDLNSVFYCTKLVIDGMIERKYGRIINMASIIGQMGNVGQSNYAAAKAGMIAFTKSAAQELARFGITVNALTPGFIETDMLAGVPEEPRAALLARIPLGRFGTAEEVGRLVSYILNDGDWITGQQFNINGGMYMGYA
ncbi:MAG: SDR family NAD(P)-dependent oxidoreductase [Dehalococcoidia bacterium]|nr:SDR family NAD(P)-dependent oxidoreductase [Dehalococcoidia bacterium]